MRSFFSGLRGKLTLTYTLVTVLALMALEVMALALVLVIASLARIDQRDYLNDIIYSLYPNASGYLQPGKQDLPGLQAWLTDVAESGFASLPPQDPFDSPAAAIAPQDPMLVIAPDYTILAQAPLEPNNPVGRRYTPVDDPEEQGILDLALKGRFDALSLSMLTSEGNTRLAVPIMKEGMNSDILGVLLVTVKPAPSTFLNTLPVYLGGLLGTGLLMLIAVAPFGALFGFVMSRGLTRRLTALSRAADAWSEGDFQPLPADRSRDEIGVLGMRLRNMAERLQNLLHTQQQLGILEERNRLARDLHDTVKQQSFATYMQVRAARNLLHSDPAAAEKHLEEAEGLIKTSQQELNLLIGELRPAALEDQGLAGALRSYLKTWYEHTRIPITLQVTGERRLPLALEQAVFRVSQEALSNVARHSHASAAALKLEYQLEYVRLEISDNGVGFDPRQVTGQGFGLESMRDRLAALGGQLEIHSEKDQGARVAAVVPLAQNGGMGYDAHANGKN
jgi:NarL family two-component system sensor histidine kinase LiaS